MGLFSSLATSPHKLCLLISRLYFLSLYISCPPTPPESQSLIPNFQLNVSTYIWSRIFRWRNRTPGPPSASPHRRRQQLHPCSVSDQKKISEVILDFFLSHPTSTVLDKSCKLRLSNRSGIIRFPPSPLPNSALRIHRVS